MVQGSRPFPYEVTVAIARLGVPVWENLRQHALRCPNSLPELLGGQFPQALKDAFFVQGTGLFPGPQEIEMSCSCPDRASMCKHVAAALYGVDSRLEQAPELLFTLRQVTVDELVSQTVQATSQDLLERAGRAPDSGGKGAAEALERVEGMQRRGLVLASLMRLKQVCNHPD